MHYLKCKILYVIYTIPTMILLFIKGVKMDGVSFYCGFPYMTKSRRAVIKIGAGCRFMSITWGNLIGLNHRCMISATNSNGVIKIGNKCSFSGISIWCFKEITIGNNVRCGANVLIMDGDAHQDDPRAGKDASIHIEDNVWIGTDVKILKGVTIGANTIIGAGSIVTKSIPPNVVAAGVPCKVIRNIELETLNKLDK